MKWNLHNMTLCNVCCCCFFISITSFLHHPNEQDNTLLKPTRYSLRCHVTVSWFTRYYCACAQCIFQSYANTVPSRLKLTMKLTMREPTFMGSMTTDTWSRRVTYDFNSILKIIPFFSLQLSGIVDPNDGLCHMDPETHMYTWSTRQVGL